MSVQSQRLKLEEEDASQLKLGPDFTNATCLMNSEVECIFKAEKEANPDEDEINPYEHFRPWASYLMCLHPLSVASLANLPILKLFLFFFVIFNGSLESLSKL